MNYQLKTDPYSSHMIIRNWLFSFPSGRIILDVGTAMGLIGSISQEAGHIFYGIEPNVEWAILAEPFYKQIEFSSLEKTKDAYLSNYDIVICADVLEHLVDPERQLARLVRLQKPGSVFIISVPNIANIWIRLQLLLGKFDYTDRGILDRSHLRFFTQKTFYKMIASAGLDIIASEVTLIPLYLALPKLEQKKLSKFLYSTLWIVTRSFPTLFGYQFIVRAKKKYSQG
jgi:2-polyprenyl-3-methyl-5-hydroxy-6-metoxy-1,4-benzoquinol methylase